LALLFLGCYELRPGFRDFAKEIKGGLRSELSMLTALIAGLTFHVTRKLTESRSQ
jgi:hypothetical protein